MKRFPIIIAIAIVLTIPFPNGQCQTQASASPDSKQKIDWNSLWGVGVKAGLNGVGLEIVKGMTEKLNVRAGYSWLAIPYSTTQNLEGYNLQVDAKVKLGGADFLADYYLWKKVRVTGGLIINQTIVGVDVRSLSSFPYGDINIPAEDVGSITAKLGPGTRISPYLAIGIGNTLSRTKRFAFNFEIGTLYQGKPQIELNGIGVIGPMASENNVTVINKAIAQFSWFPMVSFLLTYRVY
jgi:opacity protein-like surface antigen